MPFFRLDDREIEFSPGETILEAAGRAGIEIPTLCHLLGKPANASCFLCVVKAEGASRLIPSCATLAVEGMRIESETEEVRDARRTALELLLSDHLGDCIAPCQSICPARMDIPRMMRLIAERRYREALIVVKEAIPLPATLGRICPELCEKGCRRSPADGSLSICSLKRFAADRDLASDEPYLPDREPSTGKRIAIVGSGPAGLSAAYFLLRFGHSVVLFDDHERPGGMLRYGVSSDLLPEAILDAEIGVIERLGAEFRCGVKIGSDMTIEELKRDSDALLLAAGTNGISAMTNNDNGVSTGIGISESAMRTNGTSVFVARSSSSHHAIRAVAEGKSSALTIHGFLTGETTIQKMKEFNVRIGRIEGEELSPYLEGTSQEGRIAPSVGRGGYTEDEARREAMRCLHCECGKPDACKLRRYADEYGANPTRFRGERRRFERDSAHPLILFEPGKCISCGICVQIASEGSEPLGLSFTGRGFAMRTVVPFAETLDRGLILTAIECAAACPTGALSRIEEDGE